MNKDGPWEGGTEEDLGFPAGHCAFCFIETQGLWVSGLLALGGIRVERASRSSEEGENLLCLLVEVENVRASGEISEMEAKASRRFDAKLPVDSGGLSSAGRTGATL